MPPENAAASPRSPASGENFKNWVQTGGILVAAAWAAWTFIYKEITAPNSVPVNITLDLELKRINPGAPSQDLVAVEVKCSAKNPSSREIKLLPSAWIAYGSVIMPKTDDPNVVQEGTKTLQNPEILRPVLRHANRDKMKMVGTGLLFRDTELKPGETTVRSLVLYVPKNVYHQLDFVAVMPSSEDRRGIQLEWTISPDEALIYDMYRFDEKGNRIPAKFDEKGNYLDKRLRTQEATSYAAISLGP
ncbi:MAG: hypothetical protein QOF24_161 [Verrucomicrobiota bacterium]|jgi:hypothetical protein